jgi:hypothetical protein
VVTDGLAVAVVVVTVGLGVAVVVVTVGLGVAVTVVTVGLGGPTVGLGEFAVALGLSVASVLAVTVRLRPDVKLEIALWATPPHPAARHAMARMAAERSRRLASRPMPPPSLHGRAAGRWARSLGVMILLMDCHGLTPPGET